MIKIKSSVWQNYSVDNVMYWKCNLEQKQGQLENFNIPKSDLKIKLQFKSKNTLVQMASLVNSSKHLRKKYQFYTNSLREKSIRWHISVHIRTLRNLQTNMDYSRKENNIPKFQMNINAKTLNTIEAQQNKQNV